SRGNSRVRFYKAPGSPPTSANQQGPRPISITPATPEQPRRTTDTTWDYNKFFRNRQGPEPPAPPPTNKQEPRQNQIHMLSRKPNKQHGAPKKAVTNAPVEDKWTGAWAAALGSSEATEEAHRGPRKRLLHRGLESLQNQQSHI
ncbi:MAG: hypothetical protein ACKPKO_15585, partial [Candidatus Fonsibacter sp.]